MTLNEITLLCGIHMRPFLKSDDHIIERSEIEDLDKALEHLLREDLVRYEDIDYGTVTNTLDNILKELDVEKTDIDTKKIIKGLGGIMLFNYIPTEKGLAIVNEFEHLKQYMMYPELPEGMTLEEYQQAYEKEEEKFKREFIKKYFAKRKKK
ncbi:hypothetical protein MKA38_09025 [[Clostridium] innocuum]|nr:hypothetical protein [[Clostridium] innocuum]